jgi:hypothetical protein
MSAHTPGPDYRRFQPGTAVYTCRECGKRTRDTGGDEASCRVCLACFEASLLANSHADGVHDAHPEPSCPACKAEGRS